MELRRSLQDLGKFIHFSLIDLDKTSIENSWFQIAEKNGVLHIFNIASYKPILSLHCGNEPLLTADWSLCNSLLIVAAVRSEIILFDASKMTVVCRKKLPQDIVKSVKFSQFSDTLIATASLPNYDVSVTNLKSQQSVSFLSKDPVSAISWFKKGTILVSFCKDLTSEWFFLFSLSF